MFYKLSKPVINLLQISKNITVGPLYNPDITNDHKTSLWFS